VKRKQEKLATFGPRWQDGDPTRTFTRELEVRRALTGLRELWDRQRSLQEDADPECTAVLDTRQNRCVLVKRRGQVITSFGRREDGCWVLSMEESLYLTERATLAAYVSTGSQETDSTAEMQDNPCFRRLQLPELYSLTLAHMPLESYCAYAHLRRAGFTVRQFSQEAPRAPSCQSCWHLSLPEVQEVPSVHVVYPHQPFLTLFDHVAGTGSSESKLDALVLDAAHVFAMVSGVGDVTFLEFAVPVSPVNAARRNEKATRPLGVDLSIEAKVAQRSSGDAGVKAPSKDVLQPRSELHCSSLVPPPKNADELPDRYATLLRKIAELTPAEAAGASHGALKVSSTVWLS